MQNRVDALQMYWQLSSFTRLTTQPLLFTSHAFQSPEGHLVGAGRDRDVEGPIVGDGEGELLGRGARLAVLADLDLDRRGHVGLARRLVALPRRAEERHQVVHPRLVGSTQITQ